ncbi:MAG: HipA N-terminal domain-containing protein [Bacteroidetes bacterium]|nr:HipA N-terminal domain-containing protein [Bacteroidota bacterium]MBU1718354.1 HipA N-terminal domain-containing protein [Bacteroidota bacterium]
MRKAEVFSNRELAGTLIEENKQSYVFRYDDLYFTDKSKPAISLTMPKSQQEYRSKILFPFFFNMLSEGANRNLQCSQLKIDTDDNFGLLTATANSDTIGAITVKPVFEK